jgi:hypothetical protein
MEENISKGQMYNILITSDEFNKIHEILEYSNISEKRRYSSHLWVHNGIIRKNHIIFKSFKAIMKFVEASGRGYQYI